MCIDPSVIPAGLFCENNGMTRRTFTSLAAAAVFKGTPPASKLGIATTSYLSFLKPKDTLEFLEHCHGLGAAGIQAQINGDIPKLRARAEQYGMYIEAMLPVPKSKDTAHLEKAVLDAKAAGAICGRAGALSGRRYETFSSLVDWQLFVTQTLTGIKASVPVLEKYKFSMALENHKDWTVDEMVAILKDHSSEYLGACIDFGNNISLLDDPMAVVEKLAPYALSTHVKDMGVEEDKDGFLLSEVPLGEGYLDLARMVAAVKNARPKTRFVLEMITRNPLRVPCLTEKYWATFPERNGAYLARTLSVVQKQGHRLQALPRVDMLNPEAQLRLEDENVKVSLHYAREKLSF